MFQKPEDIEAKPLVQHLIENVIIDLACAPANRVLILLQTQPGAENFEPHHDGKVVHLGIRYYVKRIFEQEGILGFWKGSLFEILKNGLFRLVRSFFLNLYEPLTHVDDHSKASLGSIMFNSLVLCVVEASVQLMRHPFKVIRVRLAALENPDNATTPKGFKRVSECINRIIKEDGFRGFYRGFGVSLLESLVNVMYLSAQRAIAHKFIDEAVEETSKWDIIKEVVSERSTGSLVSAVLTVPRFGKNIQKKLRTLAFQALRYGCNLLLLYPFRVLQRRLIMQKGGLKVEPLSTRRLIKEIWRKEGLRGFYSGLRMQFCLDMGTGIISPLTARITGAMLPGALKTSAKVGDVHETVESAITEIKDTAAEKVVELTEKVEEKSKRDYKSLLMRLVGETAVVNTIKDIAETAIPDSNKK